LVIGKAKVLLNNIGTPIKKFYFVGWVERSETQPIALLALMRYINVRDRVAQSP